MQGSHAQGAVRSDSVVRSRVLCDGLGCEDLPLGWLSAEPEEASPVRAGVRTAGATEAD